MIFVHGSLTWAPNNAARKEVARGTFQLKPVPMIILARPGAFWVAVKRVSKVHSALEKVSLYLLLAECVLGGFVNMNGGLGGATPHDTDMTVERA